MKKKTTEKAFNAVGFMRKRRDELGELREKDPQEFKRLLEETGKKYKKKFHRKAKPAA